VYVEEQAFGDRQWFRPASERQRYQLQAKKHSARPLLPDSEIRAARNGQSCAKYAPSAFTDEVNCIVDNEKQKAVLVVGVRSARACVTMPSAANQ
jgi:hypothetical protein